MRAQAPSGKLATLGISVAALVAALNLPPTAPTGRADLQKPADHPVAALAWARANCDAQLSIKPGAHLEHAEVLMRVAAVLDQARAAYPLADVCRDAIAAAKPAMAHISRPAIVARDMSEDVAAAANDR